MLLKVGSTGEDVKKLQQFLGLNADGSFGPMTESKVKEFQTKNGLTADGVIGDGTWGKMFPNEGKTSADITPGPFKLEKLKGHIPDIVLAQIPDTAAKFGIINTLRLAHFLSQCGHESGGWRATTENLNYSADGLMKTFPRYFPNKALAEQYARNPEKIASKVYGARMGNGAEITKEGFKFRGRGYIQLTGKENYTSFDKFVEDDVVSFPELVASKYPLMSAAWFFNKNGIWTVCDKGTTDEVVIAVTRKVNGGTIGLTDRIKHFKEYYTLLT